MRVCPGWMQELLRLFSCVIQRTTCAVLTPWGAWLSAISHKESPVWTVTLVTGMLLNALLRG